MQTTLLRPDWAQIELDFRAGMKSLRQIAIEHGITEGAIRKRAKKYEWIRDLMAKIAAKAEALVRTDAVRKEVRTGAVATEQAVVEANAQLQYRIRIEHRADIGRARRLFQDLIGELELSGAKAAEIQALFDEAHPEPDADAGAGAHNRHARLVKAIVDVLAIPGRVESGKKVVEMLERVVRLEREAFGITNDDKPTDKSQMVLIPAKDLDG